MKKYQITPEHRIELEKIKQKYIDNAFRTDAMTDHDKDQMRIAMRGFYKNANLPYPGDDKIIFVSSPLIAQFASGFAMSLKHGHANQAAEAADAADAAEQAAEMATWQAAEAANQAAGQAARQAARQAANQATWQAANQAEEAAEAANQATWQAANQAAGQAEEAAGQAAEAAMQAARQAARQAEEAADAAMQAAEAAGQAADAANQAAEAANQAANQAARQAAGQAEEAAGQAAEAARQAANQAAEAAEMATWQAAEQAARQAANQAAGQAEEAAEAARQAAGQAEEAAGQAAEAARQAAMQELKKSIDQKTSSIDLFLNAFLSVGKKYGIFGLFSVSHAWRYRTRSALWPWHQVYGEFFKNIAKIPGEWDKWDPLNLDALHGGVRFMTPEFTIISDRPETLKIDDGVLHCENGPAIKWRDGMEMYYWRGTLIPDWWISKREELTPEIALKWENIEQARCAQEILGLDKILNHPSVNAKLIDADNDPTIGDLYTVVLREDIGPEGMLKVECGTGRIFVMRVDAQYTTALEANASLGGWRKGMKTPPINFIPMIRS